MLNERREINIRGSLTLPKKVRKSIFSFSFFSENTI